MDSPSVFGKTQVSLLPSFIEHMPSELDKAQFFEECCKNVQCTFRHDGECSSYILEGFWETVVHAQNVLTSHLQKWMSVKIGNNGTKEESNNYEETNLGNSHVVDVDANERSSHTVTLSPHPDDYFHDSNDLEPEERSQNLREELKLGITCAASSKALLAGHQDIECSKERTDNNVGTKECDRGEDFCSHPYPKPRSESVGGAFEEINLHESAEALSQVENEVYVDIQLEHNYNNLKLGDGSAAEPLNMEPAVENEIYMDIKLSEPDVKIFSNDLPVTLVAAKEDEPGIEVLQLKLNKKGCLISSSKKKTVAEQLENKELLKLRRKKYEEQTPFKYFCGQCSFKTKRHSHMRKHARLHEKVCTIFSCDQCDFSTIRASHLHRHIGTHKTEIFACSQCTYSTHTEAFLSKHERTKHVANKVEERKNKDTYQCLNCSYTTTSEKLMDRHTIVHLKKGPKDTAKRKVKLSCFKCEHCSYQTPSRSNYYRHLGTVHDDHRPFLCTTCGLCFKRNDTLVKHQATHGQQNLEGTSFKCSQCPKFYRSAHELNQHELTHGEERRYLCEVCAASFKTRAVQRKHYLEKHVHEKSHPCPVCSKFFSSKFLVKRHMKVHGSTRPLTIKSKDEICKSQSVISDSTQWCDSLVTVPTLSEDVQVFVVHQEQPQSDLSAQDTSQCIPVEYVELESADVETSINAATSGSHISSNDIITLTFI